MEKWFNENLERDRLRKYTKKQLKGKSRFDLFRAFSITNWIIAINCVIFLLVLISIKIYGEETVVNIIALQANSFFQGKYWSIISSMFVHIEAWHLIANMISLFFIGNFVERLIGRKRLFNLYIISGIFAGLFYVLCSYFLGNSIIGARIFGSPETLAVGASGAIFSLLGILAIITPYTKVYLIGGPIIALILQSVYQAIFPNSTIGPVLDLILTVYVFVSIFAMFSFNPKFIRIALPIKLPFWLLPIVAIVPLVIIGLFMDLPIGNSAHFGGLVVGLIYATYLRNKYKKKTDMIRKLFASQ